MARRVVWRGVVWVGGEVVALLVLKKKLDAKYGVDEEDSTAPSSDRS